MCDHVAWLRLAGTENLSISYSNRFKRLIHDLPSPHIQCPSLVLFLGNKLMETGLRELYPRNNLKRGRQDGILNLRIDTSSVATEYPIFFADGNPYHHIPHRLEDSKCHENESLMLDWSSSSSSALHMLYARLFCLFSDVICIFADDFGGLGCVAELLEIWAGIGSAHGLFNIRPRVIIAVSHHSASATYDLLETEDLYDRLWGNSALPRRMYSSIIIIQLAGNHLSPLARHRRLKEVLLNELDRSREARLRHRILFSATHFRAFFDQALHHAVRSVSQPFDFIYASRKDNPISSNYSNFLSDFLELAQKTKLPSASMTRFIASTIVMDAYPPRMHSKCLIEEL